MSERLSGMNFVNTDKFQTLPTRLSLISYQTNIDILLKLEKKPFYDKETKIVIANYKGKEIFITEFLFAKNRGLIDDLHGHSEFEKEYFTLLPYIFMNIEEVYKDLKSNRYCHIFTDDTDKKVSHVVDDNGFLISIYCLREKEFERFKKKSKLLHQTCKGVCAHFSILSPARATFWRHASLIQELYIHFSKNTLTQDDFIVLVDEILETKATIKEYKTLFDETIKNDNLDREIKLKKEIETMKNRIIECEKEIDAMMYALYGLSADEIAIVEGK